VQRRTFGRNGKSQKVYCADLHSTREKATVIMGRQVPADLMTISKYSLTELESMCETLGVHARSEDGKKRKKNELFDAIRVAVCQDMT